MVRVGSGVSQASYPVECEKKQEVELGNIDLESLFEQIKLENLDLNNIQDGILHISVPLKAGKHKLPGKFQDALLKVKPNTMAWLTVCLGKDLNSKTVIKKTSIEIYPPIKVKNPASAYEPPGALSGLKDLLADVVISGIDLGPKGEILFQGFIKKGPFKSDIKTEFKPEMFPKVDLNIESLTKKKVAPDFNGISIKGMMEKMGALLGEAKCSLKLKSEVPEVYMPKQGLRVQLEQKEVSAQAHTKILFGLDEKIHVAHDLKYATGLKTDGLEATLEGEVNISGLQGVKPKISGKFSSKAQVKSIPVVISSDKGARVPLVVGGKKNALIASVTLSNNQPEISSADYRLNIKTAESSPIEIRELDARFEQAKVSLRGHNKKARFKAKLTKPHLEWYGLSGYLEGGAELKIQTESLKRGQVSYKIKPENANTFNRNLDYRLHSNGQLALRPRNTGVSEFLDPVNEFVWNQGALSKSKSAPIAELGSAKWFEAIEKITQSKLRSKNRVQLLPDGVTSFPKRLEMIQNAKKSICLQTLIFKDDETGMLTAYALVEARKRGIDVYVIVDSIGNVDSPDDLIKDNEIYSLLRDNGVKVRTYNNAGLKGVRKIISVASNSEVLKGLNSLKDFMDPKKGLSTLNLLARISEGTISLALSHSDKCAIQDGLKLIFGDTPTGLAAIARLAKLSAADPLEFSEAVDIFRQVLRLNNRWHEKYLITDSREVIVGGMNIADEYMKGGTLEEVTVLREGRPAWRDTDMWIEGESALESQNCFIRNWKTITGEGLGFELPDFSEITDENKIQIIQSSPISLNQQVSHPITNLKIEAIKTLKPGEKLYEASAYFLPIGALKPYMEAVIDAAKRGVDVRIVTNSVDSTDVPQVYRAALLCCYRDMLKAGIRIFERTGERTMHQKTAVYGDKVALVGSYNLDNRSASLNSESLAVVYEKKFTKQVEDMLITDMGPEVAREIKLDEIKSFPALYELESSAWAMLGDLM